MGSFSWTKAVKQGYHANIVYEEKFKLLIPKEFGGGSITDTYQDYGILSGKVVDQEGNVLKDNATYDMYELLAFWNSDAKYIGGNGTVKSLLKYDGEFPNLKEKDQYTDHNRGIGIDIGCYGKQIDRLKYPLKLVSPNYKGTYEECEGRSYGDPNQGFYELSWKELEVAIKEGI